MKKKNTDDIKENEENPFLQSTGDLMAGLLFIFILLLMGTLVQVQKKAEQDKIIATQYNIVKKELYVKLSKEFKEELKSWEADLDSTTLSIKFKEPTMLFDKNQAVLKDTFMHVLNKFYPRYITVLQKYNRENKGKNNIEEIRIEGYADSDGRYMHNMELSQERARNVLEYCLKIQHMHSEIDSIWVKEHISANGFADSRGINANNATMEENKAASRRVEFRVKTNAEQLLEDIVRKRQ